MWKTFKSLAKTEEFYPQGKWERRWVLHSHFCETVVSQMFTQAAQKNSQGNVDKLLLCLKLVIDVCRNVADGIREV